MMGLISGVAGLFDIEAGKKKLIREEINLAEAVEAHIGWKLRLQKYYGRALRRKA